MSIEEMIARMASEERRPTISHVGKIARLQEFKDRLDAGNRFKVGEIVTPRADSPVKEDGVPHIVVDLREPDYDFRAAEGGDTSYGARFDMRVASMRGGRICLHWVEAVYFEPYEAATHEKSDRERDYEPA